MQVAVPPWGARQALQAVPQKFALLSSAQMPLQLWLPLGQVPVQAWVSGIQALRQSFLPLEQAAPHWVPSQVARPSIGAGQGSSQDMPQVIDDLLSTQVP